MIPNCLVCKLRCTTCRHINTCLMHRGKENCNITMCAEYIGKYCRYRDICETCGEAWNKK